MKYLNERNRNENINKTDGCYGEKHRYHTGVDYGLDILCLVMQRTFVVWADNGFCGTDCLHIGVNAVS